MTEALQLTLRDKKNGIGFMTAAVEKLKNWNLNTLLLAGTIAGGFIAWGVAWGGVHNELTKHSEALEELEIKVTAVEAETRLLDNHELRISNVENRQNDSATVMRSLEKTLNSLVTEVKVTREIVQRLEGRQEATQGTGK